MSVGVAAALLVVGLIVGLIVGIIIGRKTAKGKKKEKKKDAAGAAELAKALGVTPDQMEAFEQQEEEEQDEEEAEDAVSKLEREFLSMMSTPGLDDHPDIHINPIIMYKVKIAKDEDRIAKLLDGLLEAARAEPIDGLTLPTEEELAAMTPQEKAALAARMQSSGTVAVANKGVGSVAGKTRRYAQGTNSTRLLVNAGAHFTAARMVKREGEEETKAKELREQLRVIDQHLQSRLKVDTSKVDGKSSKTRVGPKGFAVDAYQKATDTKEHPFGGAAMKRQDMVHEYAARGRKRVGPPLDHMMSAGQRQAMTGDRRGSTGAGRRLSVTQQSLGRRTSVTSGFHAPHKRPDADAESVVDLGVPADDKSPLAGKLKGAGDMLNA